MIKKLIYCIKVVMLMCISSLCFSCGLVQESNDCDEEEPEAQISDKAVLYIRIKPIRNSFTRQDDNAEKNVVSEQINSLRIVILNDNGYGYGRVEVNERITDLDITGPELEYLYKCELTAGPKKFYLFANEDKVGQIEGDKVNDLSALLDGFEVGEPSVNFEESVAAVECNPEYRVSEDYEIELPYSSFYQLTLEGGKTYDEAMFLVPVATKYDVKVSNMRSANVTIKSISILSMATTNYLMPRVGTMDYYKDGKYWIDWLANISEMSHDNTEFEQNESFNNQYGWILDYTLPKKEHNPTELLKKGPVTVKAHYYPEEGKDAVAGEAYIPTFYSPESKNLSGDGLTQTYAIQLVVQEEGNDEEVVLNRTLSNVKALFRNTHLLVNVVFNEGYMHIYGEIVDWGENPLVSGYVTEEE